MGNVGSKYCNVRDNKIFEHSPRILRVAETHIMMYSKWHGLLSFVNNQMCDRNTFVEHNI